MSKAEIPQEPLRNDGHYILKYGVVGFMLLGSLVACQKGGATTSSPAAHQQTFRVISPSTRAHIPSAETTPVAPSVSVTPETSTPSGSITSPSEAPTSTVPALPSSVSTAPSSLSWPPSTGEKVGPTSIATIADTVAGQLNNLVKSRAVNTQTRTAIEGGGGKTVYLMSKQHGTNSQLPAATAQLVYASGGELTGVDLQTGNDVIVPGMASNGMYYWPTARDATITFSRSSSNWTATAEQGRTEYVLHPDAGATGPQQVVTPNFMQQLAGHMVQEL